MLGARKFAGWTGRAVAGLLLCCAVTAMASHDATVEQLKSRLSTAGAGERAKLCVWIAEKQLAESDKLYAASEMEKAESALTDAVAYSELARDYSIQTHKHEKETELAVRAMTRRLNDLMHTLGREDQGAVHSALTRLERVRDDLLKAMFSKGN